MQSESIVDFSDIQKSDFINTIVQSETESFSSKKRKRGRKQVPWSKKEEEKILKYALKLSEKEYQRQKANAADEVKSDAAKKISEIEEVTTYKATEEDFSDPMKMFDRLWNEDENSTGIVKIVPPKGWVEKQKQSLEKVYKSKLKDPLKKIYTRKQTLNELYLAKRFDHVRDYNYEEYHNLGRCVFKNLYNAEEGEIPVEKIEEDYWRQCKEQKPLSVHYAADIPMMKYFSKQELFEMINEDKKDEFDNFSLLRSNVMKNSLMQFTKKDDTNQISGITVPWFYMGMVYASFCWHTEDLYLYSLNYMHEGSPKIWYGVSHKQKDKMDEYIKAKYFATLLKQPDLIHSLTVHIDPLELIQSGIKVYRVVQNPGEMIVTLPKGYHCGVSTGLNLAEAVNFSTLKWLDFGLKAQLDYKKNNSKLSVFSMEWLIMQNYENQNETNFDEKNYKPKIKSLVNNIVGQEIDNRNLIENYFKENNINYMIEEIEKSDNIENFECDLCTYYGFLSQMQCNNCMRKGCLTHGIQCKCLPTDFTLRYRYLIKELVAIKNKKI